METVRLGRTGLEVSVAGLGTGGASRIGQGAGKTERESLQLLEAAFALGINYVDSAPNYGTEELVGKALAQTGEEVYVSTKIFPGGRDHELVTKWGGEALILPRDDEFAPLSAPDLRRAVERSLEALGTDTIDMYHLHTVMPDLYDHVLNELVPELLALRDAGKIRFLGISEFASGDPHHEALTRAVGDDCWDAFMLSFNALNPSARERVLVETRARDIGVEVMGAARGGFTNPEKLRALVRTLVEQGQIDPDLVDLDDPLGSLLMPGGAESLVDLAYRFARHEPGCHVVLTGTGTISHLEANVESINRGPLPKEGLRRLEELFGHLDDVRLGH